MYIAGIKQRFNWLLWGGTQLSGWKGFNDFRMYAMNNQAKYESVVEGGIRFLPQIVSWLPKQSSEHVYKTSFLWIYIKGYNYVHEEGDWRKQVHAISVTSSECHYLQVPLKISFSMSHLKGIEVIIVLRPWRLSLSIDSSKCILYIRFSYLRGSLSFVSEWSEFSTFLTSASEYF